jgi:hypothetical protein
VAPAVSLSLFLRVFCIVVLLNTSCRFQSSTEKVGTPREYNLASHPDELSFRTWLPTINGVITKIESYNVTIAPVDQYEELLADNSSPRYDVVVSLRDVAPHFGRGGFRHYWYPINEASDWGYGPFFWSKRILDFHTERNDRILVHCSAGVHRSPMIVLAWLLSLEVRKNGPNNLNLAKIQSLIGSDAVDLYEADTRKGRIPADLERFFQLMDENLGSGLTDCLELLGRHRAR